MTEIELLICAAVLAGLVLHKFRQGSQSESRPGFRPGFLKVQRKPNHGLPHLEQVMQGNADGEQLLEVADALAKSVIDRAKALGKGPLFITVSGDLYDDFFPPRELGTDCTPEQYANIILADCVRRYRKTRDTQNVGIVKFPAYALCVGAGLAVSAFRRLEGYSPDMRDLADFLAPVPSVDDWEQYREDYLEVGLLLNVPRARIDARLMKRRETFGIGARDNDNGPRDGTEPVQ